MIELQKRKVVIDRKYYGSVEMPDTRHAPNVFHAVRKAFSQKEPLGLHLLFGKKKLKSLEEHQRDDAWRELLELAFYIELGTLLRFNTDDAKALKERIEMLNDIANGTMDISGRLTLFNKNEKSRSEAVYLFWDIENFSNVGPMFTTVIEPFEIPDEHIYIAANPNSLFMKGPEWEADFYDYGKTLNSFNFTKCDHGKNVADTVLLEQFGALSPRNSDIYLMTYDREFKELFKARCHQSNNLYIMNR